MGLVHDWLFNVVVHFGVRTAIQTLVITLLDYFTTSHHCAFVHSLNRLCVKNVLDSTTETPSSNY